MGLDKSRVSNHARVGVGYDKHTWTLPVEMSMYVVVCDHYRAFEVQVIDPACVDGGGHVVLLP